jgi:hypothetical protein
MPPESRWTGRSEGISISSHSPGARLDPLGEGREVRKVDGVPGVGGKVRNGEFGLVALAAVLHLLYLGDADVAEVERDGLVQAVDEAGALGGVGDAKELEDGIVQLAAVGLGQFVGERDGAFGEAHGPLVGLAVLEGGFDHGADVALAQRPKCACQPLGQGRIRSTRIRNFEELDIEDVGAQCPLGAGVPAEEGLD